MQIQINPGDVEASDAIIKRIHDEIHQEFSLFEERITRIEVHLKDVNGPKAGVDKRCLMEARLAGLQPMAVESEAADLYDAIAATAGKLSRAVKHKLERLEER